jgi:tetratricopeptide (TPR) repeat protein
VAGLTVAFVALAALAAAVLGPRVRPAVERAWAGRAVRPAARTRGAVDSRPGEIEQRAPLPRPYERLARGPTRVGVAYFAGESSEGDDAHLADFVTRAVVARLREARDRSGRRLGTQFVAADATGEPGGGQTAAASYALTGTIARVGASARSQVRISDAAGTVIWREELERPLVELDRLAEDVSARAAARLGARIRVTTAGRSERFGDSALPDSSEAFDRYLRGRYLRSRYDAPSLAAAAEAYELVARIDSRAPRAHAELAAAYARLVRWNGPRPDYFTRGRAEADRALALDSGSALAWAARSALAAQQPGRSTSQAGGWARRALALAPASDEGERALGLVHLRAGNAAAAEGAFRRILARNPDDVDALVEVAALAADSRRWRDVRSLADRAIAADPKAIPAYALRALARLNEGNVRSAFGDAETAARLGRPVWGDAVRAQIQTARPRPGRCPGDRPAPRTAARRGHVAARRVGPAVRTGRRGGRRRPARPRRALPNGAIVAAVKGWQVPACDSR